MTEREPGAPSGARLRHELPGIDEAGLVAARHADRLLASAASARIGAVGDYLEPFPRPVARRRPSALRATAMRGRAAYGVKDSIRDVAASRGHRTLPRRHRSADPRAQPARGAEPELAGAERLEQERGGDRGSYTRVSDRRARVHAT